MNSNDEAHALETVADDLLLRHFCRSIAEIQWLLVILVLFYLVVTNQPIQSSPSVLITIGAYFAFSLGANYVTLFNVNRHILIATHTLLMMAFITAIIYLTDDVEGPLVSLYLVAIITSALSLGKLATLLEVVAVAACYLLLMQYSGHGLGTGSMNVTLLSANLVIFFLVGYLTTTLAETIRSANEHLKALPRLEQGMAASVERWRHVVNQSSDAIIEIDSSGVITEWNPRASSLFGWAKSEVLGQPVHELIVPEGERNTDFHDFRHFFASSDAQRISANRIKSTAVKRDGTIFSVELLLHDIDMPNERYFNAFVQDISDQERQRAQLIHRAHVDAVTRLANRHVLEERLNLVLDREHAGHLSLLMMIDLDDFKLVNDAHGHAIGDRLLRQVGARMVGVVRDRDLVARLGGDEFVVIMEQVKPMSDEQIGQVGCKLIEACARSFRIDTLDVTVTASLGIAVHDGSDTDQEKWLKRADDAMYAAKRAGKNRVHVERIKDVATESGKIVKTIGGAKSSAR